MEEFGAEGGAVETSPVFTTNSISGEMIPQGFTMFENWSDINMPERWPSSVSTAKSASSASKGTIVAIRQPLEVSALNPCDDRH